MVHDVGGARNVGCTPRSLHLTATSTTVLRRTPGSFFTHSSNTAATAVPSALSVAVVTRVYLGGWVEREREIQGKERNK